LVRSLVVLVALPTLSSVLPGGQSTQGAKSDLSGVWARQGNLRTLSDPPPPMTAKGQTQYKANKPSYQLPSDPRAIPPALGNDPAGKCDPLGLVRSIFAFRPVEFVQTPNRVFQFFEWGHIWRTIWTDGRKLPNDPPVDRFYGYDVGRWDGDTFVIESNGYDTRALISGDATRPLFPHSSAMKIEERYKRLSYGKLQATITITDPEVYTKPWTTTGTIQLLPGVELWEYLCVPSDSEQYNKELRPSFFPSR